MKILAVSVNTFEKQGVVSVWKVSLNLQDINFLAVAHVLFFTQFHVTCKETFSFSS